MTGKTTDETNFQHNVLLTERQVSWFFKAFAYSFSANINLTTVRLDFLRGFLDYE